MRRTKLQQADCIADSKTMLLFLCEGALFCSSSLISTISQTLKNIYCFSIFLFPFYILINSFIVYFHNPGMFHSSNIQQSGFSANHFHLCMETEPNKEPKSIFLHLRYAPQPYLSFLKVCFISASKQTQAFLTASSAHGANALSSPKHCLLPNKHD